MIKELPKLQIIQKEINEVVLEHIYQNTGLQFRVGDWGNYEAQPTDTNQIARLLITYDFKTQYHDNGTTKNTILLKFCNLASFRTNAICFDCVNDNGIIANGLQLGDKLAV